MVASDTGNFRPTFMFGMERSGTTLLSMITGAHHQVAVPLATTGMWFLFADRLDERYGGLRNDADIDRLLDDVLAHERIRLWRTPLDRTRIRDRIEPGNYGSVVAAVHSEHARVEGKPYWMNMDIATLDRMHVANRWFDDARFVHIVRDGRDVALSHQTMPYGSGNIFECAVAWRERVGTSLRMGDILGSDRYYRFRYEDLILDTAGTLRGLCGFLGIDYSDEMLDYGQTVDRRVPDDKLWLWPALRDAPRADKVDQWKRKMTANQRIVFETEAQSLLRELGYETFDRLPKRVGAYLLEFGYFLGRGGRIGRLKRRLGLGARPSELERKAAVNRDLGHAQR